MRPLRWLFLALIRLYYPRLAISGRQHLPAEGPVVAVLNHPNGLIDPVLLRAALGRPVSFLAKSTLFRNAVARAAMDAFEAVPVFRAGEGDTARNAQTFEACRALLRNGGWLALFPEGTSHSDPSLRPLKTGAARIALSFEASEGFAGRTAVLPVGLLYEDKTVFRSGVTLVVGRPFGLGDLAAQWAADERACVACATRRIGAALGEVVLQADDPVTHRMLLAVAAWTRPDAGRDAAAVADRARRLAAAWRRLGTHDPARADELRERVRRHVHLVETLGIRDPLTWEAPTAPSVGAVVGGLAPLALLWPLALLGAALAWLPYRLVDPVARRLIGGETDLAGTVKVLLGLVTLTVVYGGWAAAAWALAGPAAAAGMLALGPMTGFVALRFGERVERRREILRSLWLRATRKGIGAAVAERRRDLAAAVEAALRDHEADENGPDRGEEIKVGAAV